MINQDIFMREIVTLIGVVFSMIVLNNAVGYRKNSDISNKNNMLIQFGIVIVLYIMSTKVCIWGINTMSNDKLPYNRVNIPMFAMNTLRIMNEDFIRLCLNLLILIVMVLIYKMIYKVDWKKFVFLYILVAQYLNLLENVFLDRFLFILMTGGHTKSDPIVMEMTANYWNRYNLLVMAIAVILYLFLVSTIKIMNRLIKNRIYIYSSYIIMVNSLFIVLSLIMSKLEKYAATQSEKLILIGTIMPKLAILSICITGYVIIEIKRESEKMAKKERLYSKLETQNEYYTKVEESQNRIRRMYHDMNNHLENIRMMNQKCIDASDYIENIQNEINDARKDKVSGNALFDIIVDEKRRICKEEEIDFEFNVEAKDTEFIDKIDLTSILSNILDNAIEACEKMTKHKKYINLSAMWMSGLFVIECVNSKENDIKVAGNNILTSKLNKDRHGLGIKNIKSAVEKYDGEVIVKYDEDEFKIRVVIPER